jgi:hypothetical protein
LLQFDATTAERAASFAAPASAAELVVSIWSSKGTLLVDEMSLLED